VLSTAGRVKDGYADAWVREWCATAERLAADAEKAEEARRHVSARGAYLRAANYYSTGLYLITHSSAPERHLEIWRRHRACWDKFVDLAAVPGERLQLPSRTPRCLATSSALPMPRRVSGDRWWS
jgi:hypothetical protein